GESGKLQSPALKQYPWSINVTVYFLSRIFRQNAACRPSAFPVHLSSASIPANDSRFRTLSSISIGNNQKPALPADSPHTAIRIVVPPGMESCSPPVECSTPECAPQANPALQLLP